MRKFTLLLTAIAVLISIMVVTPNSSASSLSEIEKQIKEANAKIREAERKASQAENEAQQAENKKQNLSVEIDQLASEIDNIMNEIQAVAAEKNATELEKKEKEQLLLQTGIELDEAIARVKERDELMKKRTRLMYSNGVVSYLDVLLSASSFTDFLDRFDSLQLILQSDRSILEQYQADQALVEQKKAEVETQVAQLEQVYAKLEAQQAELRKKENDKEYLMTAYKQNIKELDQQIEILGEITEEQEQLLVQLASKVSKLNAEKKRIANPYSGGKLAMPIKDNYRVSSNFGTRIHPISGVKKSHNGMDFAAPSGTAIYAAEAGVVIVSDYWSGYGNCIIIDHGNGLWTLYGHIKNGGLLVDEGDTVKRGDKIALVGSTGNSTGPHLHFEVRKNEVPVNPSSYLK